MKKTLDFLNQLAGNNTRLWFNDHKPAFQETDKEFRDFVKEVELGLNQIDVLQPKGAKTFRIHRDVRFSKDKTPYNKHRSASFKRQGEDRRGGYYLRVENGQSRIVGGFFGPNSADLMHVRKQIQQEPETLRQILNSHDVKDYFGGLRGDQLKTAPKGFDKDDPAIDLLRYKQFLLVHEFSNTEVMRPDFAQEVVACFGKLRPFFDYMTEILTSNLNGEPLI